MPDTVRCPGKHCNGLVARSNAYQCTGCGVFICHTCLSKGRIAHDFAEVKWDEQQRAYKPR